MIALSAKDIRKNLGDPPQEILRGISFDIEKGQFVSLKGRSGSGKSTLLYVISTLDNPTSGELFLDGLSVKNMSAEELHRFRNEKIGFVFQFHYLLPELTALENVLMPARKTKQEKEKESYAKELLNMFDLSGKFNNRPSQLSGGQNQRVALARSLIMNPSFLFADEPTGSLDSVNSEKVFDILSQINQDFGTTIVMVTHEEEFSRRAQRVIDLKDGKVVSDSKNERT
jgi:ABC-type lipoprotein export system ATPase subunit